jgi:aminoglycoside 3-N-acetyltransferase
VIDALTELVGPEGTLLMPAFTSGSAPFTLDSPLDKSMGIIPITFAARAGVVRSLYPNHSFVAWGKYAARATGNLGYLGPLAELMELDGIVLLLGVGLRSCTAMHLAERLENMPYMQLRAAQIATPHGIETRMIEKGLCSGGFDAIRPLLDETELRTTTIKQARVMAVRIRYIVDKTRAILRQDPAQLACSKTDCPKCKILREMRK